MKLNDPGLWLYLSLREGSHPARHRRAPAGEGAGVVMFCFVVLAVFYALTFAAKFVAIGALATWLFWSGVGAIVLCGIVGQFPPRFVPQWIAAALAVIVIFCVVAWPLSVVLWLGSLG